MYSSSAIKGEKEKCFSVGMTDFLTKPFRKNDIVSVLDKWVTNGTDIAPLESLEDPSDVNEIFDFKQQLESL